MDPTIIVALIGIGGAVFGFLASSLKDWIVGKDAAKQKWLDDRRAAYIKFISSFSKPYSAMDVEDYFKNLVEASTEAYLYGDINPIAPLLIPSPVLSILPISANEAVKEELVKDVQKRFNEFDFDKNELIKDQEINSLFDLTLFLSSYRPLFSSDMLKALEGESEDGREMKKVLEIWLSDLRTKALSGFMPKFLKAIG
jgi:hypothetical protein